MEAWSRSCWFTFAMSQPGDVPERTHLRTMHPIGNSCLVFGGYNILRALQTEAEVYQVLRVHITRGVYTTSETPRVEP